MNALTALQRNDLPRTVSGMTLGERLIALRTARDWTQYKLSDAAGMGQTQLAKIEKGETLSPGLDVLLRLAGALNVSLDALAGHGDEEALPPAGRDHDAARAVHTVEVPIMAIIPGGHPAEAVEDTGDTYPLLHHLAGPGRYIIKIRGNSMHTTYWDGDLVLCQQYTKRSVPEGKVCVVRYEGESTVKRVYRRKGKGLLLEPDNREHRPIEADSEDVSIVAEVLRIVDGVRP